MDTLSAIASHSANHTGDALSAALNTIRATRSKFEFNHLQPIMEVERRLRNIAVFAQECVPALKMAWECATRTTMPDSILNIAIQYYESAIDSHADALVEAARDPMPSPDAFDQLTTRTLDLLNELAAWKALAYQPLEKKWATQRARLLQLWLEYKGNQPAKRPLNFTTDIPGSGSGSGGIPSHLAAQAFHQCPTLSQGITRSLLIELSVTGTFTRREIDYLIKTIWQVVPHIPLRSQPHQAGFLGIDPSDGRARRFSTDDATGHFPGIALFAEEISRALRFFRARKTDWDDPMPEYDRDRLYDQLLEHHWSVRSRERSHPRVPMSLPVNIHHGFKEVLHLMKHHHEEGRHPERFNGQLIDLSPTGCSLLLPKWIAGGVFAPGRLIALHADSLAFNQKFGRVVWMKEAEKNPRMLHFSIQFFKGRLSHVTMRSEEAFPSDTPVENLLLLQTGCPEDKDQHAAGACLLLPRGTYRPGRQLQDIHSGEAFVLSRCLRTCADYEICATATIPA